MLTEQELTDKWNIAFAQFTSIDFQKCEHFGTLIQGFCGVKILQNSEELLQIVPFQLHNKSHIENLLEVIKKFKTSYLGISFVQHYIHYT